VEIALLLENLGGQLDVPAGDVAGVVRTRLASESAHRRARAGRGAWWQTRPARLAFAGLVVVVAVSVALVISPTARRAVADWLGVRGVLIEQQSSPPAIRLGRGPSLGRPVSLTQARRRVSFTVLVPPTRRFGAPAEAYVASHPSGGTVTLLYRGHRGLPPAVPSNVGLLVTEFRAQIQDAVIRKVIGPGVRFEQVTVAGEHGYWFEGQPHAVFFADEHGRFFQDGSRLAGNTLLWQHGSLTLRLESALPKDQVIRVAESLTPAG
jgi:hypothetical protein